MVHAAKKIKNGIIFENASLELCNNKIDPISPPTAFNKITGQADFQWPFNSRNDDSVELIPLEIRATVFEALASTGGMPTEINAGYEIKEAIPIILLIIPDITPIKIKKMIVEIVIYIASFDKKARFPLRIWLFGIIYKYDYRFLNFSSISW